MSTSGQRASLALSMLRFPTLNVSGTCPRLTRFKRWNELNSAALEQIDQTIWLLRSRMPFKKLDTLLPHVLNFVAQMMSPLIDKIDTVDYTEQSRMLKVAEDYAVRLLQPKYDRGRAKRIAGDLVNNYPEHGFAIGIEEAQKSSIFQRSAPSSRPLSTSFAQC